MELEFILTKLQPIEAVHVTLSRKENHFDKITAFST